MEFRLVLFLSYRALSAARFHVRFGASVTTFATRALGDFLTAGDAFEVRILIEVQPDVRVTGLTDVTADVLLRPSGYGHPQQQRQYAHDPPTGMIANA